MIEQLAAREPEGLSIDEIMDMISSFGEQIGSTNSNVKNLFSSVNAASSKVQNFADSISLLSSKLARVPELQQRVTGEAPVTNVASLIDAIREPLKDMQLMVSKMNMTSSQQKPVYLTPDQKNVPASGFTMVHGSSNQNLSLEDIEIIRTSGQKQGKKGRVFGGFYGSSPADIEHAVTYANMTDNKTPTIYDINIKSGTKILHHEGDITRLSKDFIEKYTNEGYGLVSGKDVRGRTEYVVINKNAIQNMNARKSLALNAEPIPVIKRAEGGSINNEPMSSFKRMSGHLPGFSSRDDVPALLKRGEFVVKQEAVEYYGKKELDAINSRAIPKSELPKFAYGGPVGGPDPFSGMGHGVERMFHFANPFSPMQLGQMGMMALSSPIYPTTMAFGEPTQAGIQYMRMPTEGVQNFGSSFTGLKSLTNLFNRVTSTDAFDLYEAMHNSFVVLKNVYRSSDKAGNIMGQSIEMARQTPLEVTDLLKIFSTFSVNPQLRGILSEPKEMGKLATGVAGLSFLVPEQGTEGSIFAIREALAGQYRSIRNRFNINPELIAAAGGMSMSEMKEKPESFLKSLDVFLKQNLGENTFNELQMTFTKQVGNIFDALTGGIFQAFRSSSMYSGVTGFANQVSNLTGDFFNSGAFKGIFDGFSKNMSKNFASATRSLKSIDFNNDSPEVITKKMNDAMDDVFVKTFQDVSPEVDKIRSVLMPIGKRVGTAISDVLSQGMGDVFAGSVGMGIRQIDKMMGSALGNIPGTDYGPKAIFEKLGKYSQENPMGGLLANIGLTQLMFKGASKMIGWGGDTLKSGYEGQLNPTKPMPPGQFGPPTPLSGTIGNRTSSFLKGMYDQIPFLNQQSKPTNLGGYGMNVGLPPLVAAMTIGAYSNFDQLMKSRNMYPNIHEELMRKDVLRPERSLVESFTSNLSLSSKMPLYNIEPENMMSNLATSGMNVATMGYLAYEYAKGRNYSPISGVGGFLMRTPARTAMTGMVGAVGLSMLGQWIRPNQITGLTGDEAKELESQRGGIGMAPFIGGALGAGIGAGLGFFAGGVGAGPGAMLGSKIGMGIGTAGIMLGIPIVERYYSSKGEEHNKEFKKLAESRQKTVNEAFNKSLKYLTNNTVDLVRGVEEIGDLEDIVNKNQSETLTSSIQEQISSKNIHPSKANKFKDDLYNLAKKEILNPLKYAGRTLSEQISDIQEATGLSDEEVDKIGKETLIGIYSTAKASAIQQNKPNLGLYVQAQKEQVLLEAAKTSPEVAKILEKTGIDQKKLTQINTPALIMSKELSGLPQMEQVFKDLVTNSLTQQGKSTKEATKMADIVVQQVGFDKIIKAQPMLTMYGMNPEEMIKSKMYTPNEQYADYWRLGQWMESPDEALKVYTQEHERVLNNQTFANTKIGTEPNKYFETPKLPEKKVPVGEIYMKFPIKYDEPTTVPGGTYLYNRFSEHTNLPIKPGESRSTATSIPEQRNISPYTYIGTGYKEQELPQQVKPEAKPIGEGNKFRQEDLDRVTRETENARKQGTITYEGITRTISPTSLTGQLQIVSDTVKNVKTTFGDLKEKNITNSSQQPIVETSIDDIIKVNMEKFVEIGKSGMGNFNEIVKDSFLKTLRKDSFVETAQNMALQSVDKGKEMLMSESTMERNKSQTKEIAKLEALSSQPSEESYAQIQKLFDKSMRMEGMRNTQEYRQKMYEATKGETLLTENMLERKKQGVEGIIENQLKETEPFIQYFEKTGMNESINNLKKGKPIEEMFPQMQLKFAEAHPELAPTKGVTMAHIARLEARFDEFGKTYNNFMNPDKAVNKTLEDYQSAMGMIQSEFGTEKFSKTKEGFKKAGDMGIKEMSRDLYNYLGGSVNRRQLGKYTSGGFEVEGPRNKNILAFDEALEVKSKPELMDTKYKDKQGIEKIKERMTSAIKDKKTLEEFRDSLGDLELSKEDKEYISSEKFSKKQKGTVNAYQMGLLGDDTLKNLGTAMSSGEISESLRRGVMGENTIKVMSQINGIFSNYNQAMGLNEMQAGGALQGINLTTRGLGPGNQQYQYINGQFMPTTTSIAGFTMANPELAMAQEEQKQRTELTPEMLQKHSENMQRTEVVMGRNFESIKKFAELDNGKVGVGTRMAQQQMNKYIHEKAQAGMEISTEEKDFQMSLNEKVMLEAEQGKAVINEKMAGFLSQKGSAEDLEATQKKQYDILSNPATTKEEKAAAQKEIDSLNAIGGEKKKYEEILSSSTATESEKKDAKERLDILNNPNTTNMEKINKLFEGNEKQYKLAIGEGETKTPLDQLNEAGSLGKSLSDLAGVVKSVSEAFQGLLGALGSTGESDTAKPPQQT